MKQTIQRRGSCRVCRSGGHMKLALDLGMTPLANSYLKAVELDRPEEFYPLKLNQCTNCGNIQLAHVVDPKVLFRNYLYVSSTSPVFVKHFEDFAKSFLPKKEFVVDIGSNDGILLKPFKELGSKVLGVEPARNIDSVVPTIHDFWSKTQARIIRRRHGWADLITATNVFAHIDDLDDVVDGVKILLSPNGQFVVEVVDTEQMLKDGTFDMIYHEHLNYWTEATLRKFFELRDMEVTKVERVPVHGGSLRVYARISEQNQTE